MKEDTIIKEYFDLSNTQISCSNDEKNWSDSWDESHWSDEPKSGCWGDW